MIPPLLEATEVDGVMTYDLPINSSSHDFGNGTTNETLAFGEQSVLGPTMRWRSGDDVAISVKNNLEVSTTTHWHGADVPAEDDGGPHSLIKPGGTWVADFPVIQSAATLWYHPHMMGTTAEQAYFGAAGMIIVEDDNPSTQNLPANYGVNDIPVVLQDKEFDDNGELVFEVDADEDGDNNDAITVNGTLDPYAVTASGPVRLRLVNASQARVYEITAEGSPMRQIAGDGGYLQAPVEVDSLILAPGDRAEILVDTSEGTVDLVDGRIGRLIEVVPDTTATVDAVEVPASLATIERFSEDQVVAERTFSLDQVTEDAWAINDNQMDMTRVDESIPQGNLEKWTVSAEVGIHTFHIHQIQFQILSMEGAPPPPELSGWEDNVLVFGGSEVELLVRFSSYKNPETPYMYHCHILDHEDTGMMGQFEVV